MSIWKQLFASKDKEYSANTRESGQFPEQRSTEDEKRKQTEKETTVSKAEEPTYAENKNADPMTFQKDRRRVRIFISSTFKVSCPSVRKSPSAVKSFHLLGTSHYF